MQLHGAALDADLLRLFLEKWNDIVLLKGIRSQLEWDELTYSPLDSASLRGQQQAIVGHIISQHLADGALWEAVQHWRGRINAGQCNPLIAVNIIEAERQIRRFIRVPSDLLRRFIEQQSLSHATWEAARKSGDFTLWEPELEKMVVFAREVATCMSDGEEPYKAMLGEYEPGIALAEIEQMFKELREQLVPLALEAASLPQPKTDFLSLSCPIEKQEALSRHILDLMGFNFSRGRVDLTTHPFTNSMGPKDVRIGTRFHEDNVTEGVFSALHEGGHGIYEQMVDPAYGGMPVGELLSMGLHEAQSRFWEVWIGRSSRFWEYLWPTVKDFFPILGERATHVDMFRAVNQVTPSLVRTDADPVTYNLHILFRFELERGLIRKDISVHDLPGLWNESIQKYLGVEPKSDREGILQDIHWAQGLFGYFPTYTLGNIGAAAEWQAAQRTLPLHEDLRLGKFLPLLFWLRKNIYRHANRYRFHQLLNNIGTTPTVDLFVQSLKDRLGEVYNYTF